MSAIIKVCEACQPKRVVELTKYFGHGECQSCGAKAIEAPPAISLEILTGSGNAATARASRSALEGLPAPRLAVIGATVGLKDVPVITSQEDADRVFGKGEMDFDHVTRHLPKAGATVIGYEPDSEDGR